MSAVNIDLDSQIERWRERIGASPALTAQDLDELEGHLRDQIDALIGVGLSQDEAFWVGVGRVGRVDVLTEEFAQEHSERLWKQLGPVSTAGSSRRRFLRALGLAVLAAVIARLAGIEAITRSIYSPDAVVAVVLLVLACLACFFTLERGRSVATTLVVAGGFVGLLAVMIGYPFTSGGATQLLAFAHAVVVAWLLVGIASTGRRWRDGRARMDFIRFTGEWVVYYGLIAIGGGALLAITAGVFSAIGIDVSSVIGTWLLPCGAAGAVVVAAWLVEAKKAVIENIAPVLARLFTPLLTVTLVALIVAYAIQGRYVEADRDLLIIFDLVLVAVLALLLYSYSAKDPLAPAGWFERVQAVMIGSALLIDAFVLIAMVGRIGTYGASANKLASLGLNLILLANLVWAMALQVRFVTGRVTFSALEDWQTRYVVVYLAWAVFVVTVLPLLFRFV